MVSYRRIKVVVYRNSLRRKKSRDRNTFTNGSHAGRTARWWERSNCFLSELDQNSTAQSKPPLPEQKQSLTAIMGAPLSKPNTKTLHCHLAMAANLDPPRPRIWPPLLLIILRLRLHPLRCPILLIEEIDWSVAFIWVFEGPAWGDGFPQFFEESHLEYLSSAVIKWFDLREEIVLMKSERWERY